MLNGGYAEYYPNKNLKVQGRFDLGTKTGVWKTWTESGTLISMISYERGRRVGEFSEYDSNGKMIRKGTYQNDQLEGKIYTYQKDSVATVSYKQGKVVPPSSGKPFWKKIRLFKKRTAQDSAAVKARP